MTRTSQKITRFLMLNPGMLVVNIAYTFVQHVHLRAKAISSIENLVLSFLTQMNLSLQESSRMNYPADRPASFEGCKVAKIELQLADRKKIMADGYSLLKSVSRKL